MLITTVVDEYDPQMNMSHHGCYGYVYEQHQTEVSVAKAWCYMHGCVCEKSKHISGRRSLLPSTHPTNSGGLVMSRSIRNL